MSDIENRTKVILEGVCWDGRAELTLQDQIQLATWLTLKTITGEYNFGTKDLRMIAIPDSERTRFYNQRAPLEGWQIFVGAYKGQKSHRHRRQINGGPQIGFLEQTAIWCGSLFATTVTAVTMPGLPPAPLPAVAFPCIWPASGKAVQWAGRYQLTDYDADRGYNMMSSVFKSVAQMTPTEREGLAKKQPPSAT